MLKNFTALLGLLIIPNLAFSDSQNNNLVKKTLPSLNGGLVVETRSINSKDGFKVKGFDMELKPSLGYNIQKNTSLSIAPVGRIISRPKHEADFQLEILETKIKQSNILSENDYGLDLSTEYRLGVHLDSQLKNTTNTNGYHEVRANLSKNINEKLNVTSILRYDKYLLKNSHSNQLKGATRFYFVPDYKFNNLFSFSSYFIYINKKYTVNDFNDMKNIDVVEWVPSLNYFIKKDLTLTFYAEFDPIVSHDNRMIAHNFEKNPILGLIIEAKIF